MIKETGNKQRISFHSFYTIIALVKKFATDAIVPKVKEMDESEQMDAKILLSLFENGVKKIIERYFKLFSVDGN